MCKSKAEILEYADYLDFDYDAISQTVVLSAFWHGNQSSGTWDESIDNRGGSDQAEIGVLTTEKPKNLEEVSLGGFLVVLGEDKKLSM